jgi:hypothetical protein
VVIDSEVWIPVIKLSSAPTAAEDFMTVSLPEGAFLSFSGAPSPAVSWRFQLNHSVVIDQSPTQLLCVRGAR